MTLRRSNLKCFLNLVLNLKLEVKEAKKIEDHIQWKFDEEIEEEEKKAQEDDEYTTESDNEE